MAKDKELEKSHPFLTVPYLKLESREIIGSDNGIASYLARSNMKANLFGKGTF